VVVSNASASESATSGNNGEIYFTIENTNAAVDILFSAAVAQSFAKSASVHEAGSSSGAAATSMTDVTSVKIPANGTVTFEPGGYHVMLTGLAAPLKAGQKFDLNLGFMNAGIIKVTVTVKAS
jgi:copper(I)-binding protein